MKYLIKNGEIIDGSKQPAFRADILIENEIIKVISKTPLEVEDATIIDASGLKVVPGFIDTHSHSDIQVLKDPILEPKVRQGITTEVLGQDGISCAPLPKTFIAPWSKNLAGLDGEGNGLDWNKFKNTKKYLKYIKSCKPALNECYLVPHGNIRMEAMGLDDKLPNELEIKKMCKITDREMKAGAVGLSTGLIYMPCAYSESKELIEMCKVVAQYDGLFVIHQRSEADNIIDSMKEVIKIGKESGVRIHFSHFKVCGKNNWNKIDQVIELLQKAEEEGIDVSFDQYPYVAGSTMMGAILPPWVHSGGTDKVLERLADKELRKKMIHDIEHGIEGWDNFIDFAGLDKIFVTSVKTEKNKEYVGKSLTEIAKLQNKDPYDAAFDLLLEEENAVGMVDFYGLEEHVVKFMKLPQMNACTDGLLSGKPHPRVYGAFPRIIGKYVREDKVINLEDAVYKMTKKPAETFRIEKRGEIKEGYFADITIFDFNTIIDKGTFENPIQYPEGIKYVFVNGGMVVNNCKITETFEGKVLRKIGSIVK